MQFSIFAPFVLVAAFLPSALAGCESGLDHHLGDSCHNHDGDLACSSSSRAYIVSVPSLFIPDIAAWLPAPGGCVGGMTKVLIDDS